MRKYNLKKALYNATQSNNACHPESLENVLQRKNCWDIHRKSKDESVTAF
jgi:hypothetical protein